MIFAVSSIKYVSNCRLGPIRFKHIVFGIAPKKTYPIWQGIFFKSIMIAPEDINKEFSNPKKYHENHNTGSGWVRIQHKCRRSTMLTVLNHGHGPTAYCSSRPWAWRCYTSLGLGYRWVGVPGLVCMYVYIYILLVYRCHEPGVVPCQE